MNILVTGIAGSGKSTIAELLVEKGISAIDADKSEYSHWVDRTTGEGIASRPKDTDWVGRFDWIWKQDVMNELLHSERSSDLFVCGTSHNQSDFYPLFDKIFLLSIDAETIRHRLTTRTNNRFGKRPGDIEFTLSWFEDFESGVLAAGAIRLDAKSSINELIETILEKE